MNLLNKKPHTLRTTFNFSFYCRNSQSKKKKKKS